MIRGAHPDTTTRLRVSGGYRPRWGTFFAGLLTVALLVRKWDLYSATDLCSMAALFLLELAAIDLLTRQALKVERAWVRAAAILAPAALGSVYVAQVYSSWVSGGFLPPIALANQEVTGLISFSGAYQLLGIFLLAVAADAIWNARPPARRPGSRALLGSALLLLAYAGLVQDQPLSRGIIIERGEAPISSFVRTTIAYRQIRSISHADAATLNSIRAEFTRRSVYDQGFPPELLRSLPDRPNVIVVFTEGMSARWMEAYGGSHPGLTPHLDAFAQKSITFTNYYNHTAATFRGLRGQLTSGHQEVDGYYEDGRGFGQRDVSGDVTAISRISLPEILRGHGYRSMFFLSQEEYLNKMIATLGFDRTLGRDYLFDTYLRDHTHDRPKFLPDRELFETMLRELESQPTGSPFFAAVYNFGTHAFLDGELKYGEGDNEVLNRFHTYDRDIGRFLRDLMASPLHDNTVIVVTSDHSTYPGPHAVRADRRKPPHFVDAIPLLVYWKGVEPTTVDAGGRNSLSLAPTLLSMLGIRDAPNLFMGCTLFETCALERISSLGSEYILTTRDGSYRETQVPEEYRAAFHEGKRTIERYKKIDLIIDSSDGAHDMPERMIPARAVTEELPVGDPLGPLVISGGDVVKVRIRTASSDPVRGIGVRIGNFAGASDGDLSIRVCKANACASGRLPLPGTQDNAHADVSLQPHLDIDVGDELAVEIGKEGGAHPLAIWLHSASTAMIAPDGAVLEASPAMRLVFD